jgi:hypothetical protein
MPNTRTAPRKAARRVPRKRIREPGKQLAVVESPTPPYPDLTGGYEHDRFSKQPEEHCDGCDRVLPQFLAYRERIGARTYCVQCARLPLPTHAEMVDVVRRAFEIVAAAARGRDTYESLAADASAGDRTDPALADLDIDQWQNIANVWEYLAYRPRKAI